MSSESSTATTGSSQSKGVALITGSAQYLGRAIALKLASLGYDIGLNDLPSKLSLLEEVEKEIHEKYGPLKTVIVPADVTKETEVIKMVEDVVEKLGGLDVVSFCVAYYNYFLRRYKLTLVLFSH
jgi:NAD(P)-dependent dehydrogenase (short-subunit alcohol dehydrogenase family)